MGGCYSGWASLIAQWKRICLPIQEMWVQPLGQEDPLEKEMATYSTILAWEIPQIEEPGGLQPMGSQRVRHNLETKNDKYPDYHTLVTQDYSSCKL